MSAPESNIARRRASARDKASESYLTKRYAIISAAAHVFERKGYDATSFQDIADEVGVDRSSLYYYISSKEQLFRDVVHGALSQGAKALDRILEADASAGEKLRLVAESLMAAYAENYPYMFVWIRQDLTRVIRSSGQNPHEPDELVELGERYRVAVETILAAGIRDGEFRDLEELGVVALAFLGMINWSHRWFSPRGSLPAEEVARIFWDMVVNGLVQRV